MEVKKNFGEFGGKDTGRWGRRKNRWFDWLVRLAPSP